MVGMIPAAAGRTGRKGTGTEVGGGWLKCYQSLSKREHTSEGEEGMPEGVGDKKVCGVV